MSSAVSNGASRANAASADDAPVLPQSLPAAAWQVLRPPTVVLADGIDPKSRPESVRSRSSVAPPRVLFPILHRSRARPGFDKSASGSTARESSAMGADSGILQDPFAMSVRARAI